ncbi:MAG: redox-regulated ATPase YchF, partial [Candidatus Paceibacteria bacterium]
MSVSIGIVGLPNVGKSTLFETLTNRQVSAENYPFCTIDPNVGTVAVPDKRLDTLGEISQSAEIKPTTIEFIDIAGLVKGAHEGEGLGNAFLSNIREVDAICHVLRDFEEDSITHVENRVDPLQDSDIIDTELLLADLQQTERALENLAKKVKQGDSEAIATQDVLQRIHAALSEGTPLRKVEFSKEEEALIKPFNFLTKKPMMYVVNTDDSYQTRLTAYMLNG